MHQCQNAQWDLLNSDVNGKNTAKSFDILLLQEPYLDYLGNPKATRAWRLIKPTHTTTHPEKRPRSIILVNSKIPTDQWEEINIENGNQDITAVQLKGEFGRLTLFNVYNDQNHSRTLPLIDTYITQNKEKIRNQPNDYIYLGGDMNRHHPMWENDANTQLLTARHIAKAQQIIDLATKHELTQTLPKGIPTFYSAPHDSWTRPDNVFCSETLTNLITICDVDKENMSGPGIDHMPINTTLDLKMTNIKKAANRNFKETDWKSFNKTLEAKLTNVKLPDKIHDELTFHTCVNKLTQAIQETIKNEVKEIKPFPLSKRWWSKELTERKKEVRSLAAQHYKYRALPEHPSHGEYKRKRNKYGEEIKKQKTKHWEEYLTNATDEDTPTINLFITEPPTDGSAPRTPTLKYKDDANQTIEAATNEEKAKAFSKAFFPPKPTNTHIPENYQYPTPIRHRCRITEERVGRQIAKLKPYKAPGPDGIPNVVWQECQSLLTPHLAKIFRASFDLKTYSPSWKEWTTIVLRKPGKPRYDNPKAWRPIALMNTMGKILTALVAEDMSYLCEKHHLLPKNHFGGRPGRTTTDAIHLLIHRIKAAWRRGKVISVLFLDIEGAFPNAVLERLLHNMKRRRLPEDYVEFTRRQLENRRTKLSFDDYISDWITIDNGTGQGDPASMFDYLIYNSDLIEEKEREAAEEDETTPIQHSARERNTQKKEEVAAAYVDDTWFMAEGNDFEETNATLKDMMERKGGGLEWSKTHNSKFELTKTVLICFTKKREPSPQNRKKTIPIRRPPLIIQGTTIQPSASCRYLGVIIDQELKWKEQEKAMIAKATNWTMAFRRMAHPSKGVQAKLMLKLYKTVLIPKITYAIDTWYRPPTETRNTKKKGMVGISKQLTKIQRKAVLAITGAMKTTATDTLEAHANILPTELLLLKTCQRTALRLATLPDTHPLHGPIKQSAKKIVKRHPGPLHHLMALIPHKPEEIEKITPTRKPPNYKSPVETRIASTREESRKIDESDTSTIKIYSDGSAYEGGVGAAAVMYQKNKSMRSLKYHLGPETLYTVANAEAVGANLGAHLLNNLRNLKPSDSVTFNIT